MHANAFFNFVSTNNLYRLSLPPVIVGEYGECLNQFDRDAVLQNINTNISNILIELTKDVSAVPECGEGMWHQLVNLDMNDPSQECPSIWRQLQNKSTGVQNPRRSII